MPSSGRSRSVSLIQKLCIGRQPTPHAVRIAKMPLCKRSTVAYFDGMAADEVDHGEAIFIGRIVADEDWHAPDERRLQHEIGNGRSLVAPAGLQFIIHLAGDELELGAETVKQFTHG